MEEALFSRIINPRSWHLHPKPIIKPSLETEGDNIYAPCVLYEDRIYKMWYGGQGKDGHDRIHYAVSEDGINWLKKGVVLDCGSSNHVNDPSVVKVAKTYHMFYTRAQKDEIDRIHLATSQDGLRWNIKGEVLGVSDGHWDSLKVGRPSVFYEDGFYKMWYDGSDGKNRHISYAVSEYGTNFEKFKDPVFQNAGAVNVRHIEDRYVMLYESVQGTMIALGSKETQFQDNYLLIKAGSKLDPFGHVTPFLSHSDQKNDAVIYLGLATIPQWCRNRIGMAVLNKDIYIE
jgi:predicted GH43/DUF377 family glycosyl hydrolase